LQKKGADPSIIKGGFCGIKGTPRDELPAASMEKFAGNGQRSTRKSDENVLAIIHTVSPRLIHIPAKIRLYPEITVE
jgi:hypothetical protein